MRFVFLLIFLLALLLSICQGEEGTGDGAAAGGANGTAAADNSGDDSGTSDSTDDTLSDPGFVEPTEEVRHSIDPMLQTVAFYMMDESCKFISGFVFGERFYPVQLDDRIKVNNLEKKAATQGCTREVNGIVPIMYGHYILALSRIPNEVGFGYSVYELKNKKFLGEGVSVESKKFAPTERAESRLVFRYEWCFNDLQAFVICLVQHEDKSYSIKRFFYDVLSKQPFKLMSDSPLISLPINRISDIANLMYDQNAGHFLVAQLGSGGAFDHSLEELPLYALDNPPRHIITSFDPKKGAAATSINGFRYIFVAPKHHVRKDGEMVVNGKIHSYYRSVLDAYIMEKETTVTGRDIKGFEPKALHHPQIVHIDANVHYLTHGVYGIPFGKLYEFAARCGNPELDLGPCETDLAGWDQKFIVAIVLVCVTSLVFLLVAVIIVMVILFCVKERKRRHRRKHRKHKGGKKKSSGPPKPGEEAKAGDKKDEEKDMDEGAEDKKDEKGMGGFFAQQMRKLAQMDEFDEMEKEKKEGDKGAASEGPNADDDSKYVLAKDHFGSKEKKSNVQSAPAAGVPGGDGPQSKKL
ncbi:unnamed protein product [Bursaphelenchus okinawaensis]|uniref:Uncharacterized protein n=1 Tax=Bursaphelenchus okinawaensis TaxID=465554 RepID=A0A811K0S4_9BILA|nr:unnamed protein product [Bursaphelenchus okinawaensis]CAG9088307.1 unnamed protein product [Bursaphelenchus okinawaensis]